MVVLDEPENGDDDAPENQAPVLGEVVVEHREPVVHEPLLDEPLFADGPVAAADDDQLARELAVACSFATDNPDCPFSSDMLLSLYYMANPGAHRKPLHAILQEIKAAESPASRNLGRLLLRLKRKKYLTDFNPGTVTKTLIPSAYVDFLKGPGKDLPGFGDAFRVAVHAPVIANGCEATVDDLVQLTTHQKFLLNYFTPMPRLPGLLLDHATGTGKTIAAIAMITSSWIFEKDCKVIWVSEDGSQMSHVNIDAVNKMAHMALRELVKDNEGMHEFLRRFRDVNDPAVAIERIRYLKHTGNFVASISYEQFTHSIVNMNPTTDAGMSLVGRWENCVVIIDEAHSFIDFLENDKRSTATWAQFQAKIDETRSPMPGPRNMARFVLLSATPAYKSPLTLFKLMYIAGAQWQRNLTTLQRAANKPNTYPKMPMTMKELDAWRDPATGMLLATPQRVLEQVYFRGLVSSISILQDPSRFPQVASDTWYMVNVSNVQLKMIDTTNNPGNKYYYSRRGRLQRGGQGELPKYRRQRNKLVNIQGRDPYPGELEQAPDENFAVYSKEYMADNPGFDAAKKQIAAVDARYLSPKFQVLLTNIDRLRRLHPNAKHAVYTGPTASCKQLWSLLIANGFTNPYNENAELQDNKLSNRTAGMLSTEVIYNGVPMYTRSNPNNGFDRTKLAFNSRENADGSRVNILVFDHTVQQAHDLLDVRFLHIMEPTTTSFLAIDAALDPAVGVDVFKGISARDATAIATVVEKILKKKKDDIAARQPKVRYLAQKPVAGDDMIAQMAKYEFAYELDTVQQQIIGRVTRNCGHPSIKFADGRGWQYDIFRYYAMVPTDTRPSVKTTKEDRGTVPAIRYIMQTKPKQFGIDIKALLLNWQLHRILRESSIERNIANIPPDAATLDKPHPNLGYPVNVAQRI